MKNTVVEIIVNQIIDWLQKGNIPRKRTWYTRGQKNLISKQIYKWFNQILLSSIASANSWPWYRISKKQAIALWGKVKDNTLWTQIAWYKTREKLVEESGKMVKKLIPTLRYYTVYNLAETELIEIPIDDMKEVEMNMELEKNIQDYMKNEWIGLFQSKPCYDLLFDKIWMPDKNDFFWLNERYQVFFHEIVHSTGADKRLKRKLETFSMDQESYSKEELVAEIGASILMNENWLDWNKENTQAYINGWISTLKEKPQLIISAWNKAFRAVEFYMDKIK